GSVLPPGPGNAPEALPAPALPSGPPRAGHLPEQPGQLARGAGGVRQGGAIPPPGPGHGPEALPARALPAGPSRPGRHPEQPGPLAGRAGGVRQGGAVLPSGPGHVPGAEGAADANHGSGPQLPGTNTCDAGRLPLGVPAPTTAPLRL